MTLLSNPAGLRRRGIEILVRELGCVDAMRFLHQYDRGRGDYTAERGGILPQRTDEEILRRSDELADPRPRT